MSVGLIGNIWTLLAAEESAPPVSEFRESAVGLIALALTVLAGLAIFIWWLRRG